MINGLNNDLNVSKLAGASGKGAAQASFPTTDGPSFADMLFVPD